MSSQCISFKCCRYWATGATDPPPMTHLPMTHLPMTHLHMTHLPMTHLQWPIYPWPTSNDPSTHDPSPILTDGQSLPYFHWKFNSSPSKLVRWNSWNDWSVKLFKKKINIQVKVMLYTICLSLVGRKITPSPCGFFTLETCVNKLVGDGVVMVIIWLEARGPPPQSHRYDTEKLSIQNQPCFKQEKRMNKKWKLTSIVVILTEASLGLKLALFWKTRWPPRAFLWKLYTFFYWLFLIGRRLNLFIGDLYNTYTCPLQPCRHLT